MPYFNIHPSLKTDVPNIYAAIRKKRFNIAKITSPAQNPFLSPPSIQKSLMPQSEVAYGFRIL